MDNQDKIEQVAKIIAARVLYIGTPVFPFNFYEAATEIAAIFQPAEAQQVIVHLTEPAPEPHIGIWEDAKYAEARQAEDKGRRLDSIHVYGREGAVLKSEGCEACQTEAQQTEDKDALIYPCADCGKMRSENQGGTVFTLCEECWEKHYGKKDGEIADLKAEHLAEKQVMWDEVIKEFDILSVSTVPPLSIMQRMEAQFQKVQSFKVKWGLK